MNVKWVIDLSAGTATHENSMALLIDDGEIVNIETLPSSVKPKDIPGMMKEALLAYKNCIRESNINKPDINKPRRPLLTLKKKTG